MDTLDNLQPGEAAENTDAFGPVALASFALNPTGAHLFRAQHERILRTLDAVTACIEGGLGGDEAGGVRALAIRRSLTSVLSMLAIHQALEDALVRRALAQEPRMRLVVEQFEREMAPLVSELAALSRRFPTPSSVLRSPTEFADAYAGLLAKLQERLRAEERELHSVYDRTARVSSTGALLAAAQG